MVRCGLLKVSWFSSQRGFLCRKWVRTLVWPILGIGVVVGCWWLRLLLTALSVIGWWGFWVWDPGRTYYWIWKLSLYGILFHGSYGCWSSNTWCGSSRESLVCYPLGWIFYTTIGYLVNIVTARLKDAVYRFNVIFYLVMLWFFSLQDVLVHLIIFIIFFFQNLSFF